MSDTPNQIGDGERDALGAIADDSLEVFRAGLFMIVIYISILSLTLWKRLRRVDVRERGADRDEGTLHL